MKRLLSLVVAFIFAGPLLAHAQTCPSSITTIGGETSCWVPPNSGTSIADLVDTNPLTIAAGSTSGFPGGNTLGCGTGSSAQPQNINAGCTLTSTQSYTPSAITLVMKFAGTGGPLAQFASTSSTAAPFQYYELYLDTFGRLSFGTNNYGAFNVIQSGTPDKPQSFADGNPHIVVVSLGANGMQMYVDGSPVASNSQTLANYATGLWLFGTAAPGAWPYAPAQGWFNGTLYYWAWWNSQLTNAQMASLSNPGTNPPAAITNTYTTLSGQIASLATGQGLAYANLPVTFTVDSQLPASCGSTLPLARSSQTYYTDAQGNLPANLQLPQGAHVNMLLGSKTSGAAIPLVMPCQTSIALNVLLPAQTPLPDAVSQINLAGAQYQGSVVSNPSVGTVGPATITGPATAFQTGSGGTLTLNRTLGSQQVVTLTASTTITFSNLIDGPPPIVVDVIENATGGFSPTFTAPTGYTLVWPGGSQPSQVTTANTYTIYQFLVENTTIRGSVTQAGTGGGGFPLNSTANGSNFSIINLNGLITTTLTTPSLIETPTCTTGCSTTYTYNLVCNGDNSTQALVTTQTAVNNATLSSTNYNTASWSTGTGCQSYSVYGRISGSLGLLATCPGGTNCTGSTSYKDDGSATLGAAPPTANSTGELIIAGPSTLGPTKITANGATIDTTIANPTLNGLGINGELNIRQYGAKGGAKYQIPSGTISGTTFTRADGGSFVSTDVGKTIIVQGAGTLGNPYQGTITAFTNSTTVTISGTPTAVTSKNWSYGWDDTVAAQACLTAAGDVAKDCFAPQDIYLITAPLDLGDPVGDNVVSHLNVQIGTGNGVTTTFTSTLTTPVMMDGVFVWADQLGGAGGRQVWVDESQNGGGTNQGIFLSYQGNNNGSINYGTGALSITFPTAPSNGAKVWVSYYTTPGGGNPVQRASQAGLLGAGSFSTVFVVGPNVTSYAFFGPNESSKTFRGWAADAAISDNNGFPFGGLAVPYTNGAPSTKDRVEDLIMRQFQVDYNLDFQNDSTLDSFSAENRNSGLVNLGGAFFAWFGNGTGGQMWFDRVIASWSPVDITVQNGGFHNSFLTGVRLFDAEADNITIDNTQIFPDPLTNNAFNTLTGQCNAQLATSLNLTNVWIPGATSGAIAGHWTGGGLILNTSFNNGTAATTPVFGTLDAGTCNGALPLFTFINSGNNGTMGPNANPGLVKWRWCLDGVSTCATNYDDLKSTGTTFTGIGTPGAPNVTATCPNGACATAYTYFQVDIPRNGTAFITPASAGASVNNNASLDATHYNLICPRSDPGAIGYYILKTNTSTVLGIPSSQGSNNILPASEYQSFSSSGKLGDCVIDNGANGTAAFTPATIDTSGALLADFLQLKSGAIANCLGITNAATGACNTVGTFCSFTDDNTACAFSAVITNGGTHKGIAHCDGTSYRMAECN